MDRRAKKGQLLPRRGNQQGSPRVAKRPHYLGADRRPQSAGKFAPITPSRLSGHLEETMPYRDIRQFISSRLADIGRRASG